MAIIWQLDVKYFIPYKGHFIILNIHFQPLKILKLN